MNEMIPSIVTIIHSSTRTQSIENKKKLEAWGKLNSLAGIHQLLQLVE